MVANLAHIANLKRGFAGKQKLRCQVELLNRGRTKMRVPNIELWFGRDTAGPREKAISHANWVAIGEVLGPVLKVCNRCQEGWVLRHAQPGSCAFRVIRDGISTANYDAGIELCSKADTRHELVIVRVDQGAAIA